MGGNNLKKMLGMRIVLAALVLAGVTGTGAAVSLSGGVTGSIIGI